MGAGLRAATTPTPIPSSKGKEMNSELRMESRRIVTALLLVLTVSIVRATEHRIECPVKLDSDSVQVSSPPGDWSTFVSSGFWLHAVAPMDGPPSIRGFLQEDSNSQVNGKKVMKWTLGRGDGSYPDGKWLACFYGESNEVILSKRIDDHASECTVTYAKNKLGRNDIDVRCSW